MPELDVTTFLSNFVPSICFETLDNVSTFHGCSPPFFLLSVCINTHFDEKDKEVQYAASTKMMLLGDFLKDLPSARSLSTRLETCAD